MATTTLSAQRQHEPEWTDWQPGTMFWWRTCRQCGHYQEGGPMAEPAGPKTAAGAAHEPPPEPTRVGAGDVAVAYIRELPEARQMVYLGDLRVAKVARELEQPGAWAGAAARRQAATELALHTLVDLCRRGYRIGWDGLRAVAIVLHSQPGRHPSPAELALRMIAEGLAEPEPGLVAARG